MPSGNGSAPCHRAMTCMTIFLLMKIIACEKELLGGQLHRLLQYVSEYYQLNQDDVGK
jgi:hypothetical protein